METAIILVDHGSRRAESNELLLEIAARFAEVAPYDIIEPAHMELAEPSIDTAFGRCVARGAKRIVVYPYFLLPGRHWSQDIPALAEAAAARHGQIAYLVAAPLGLHPLMHQIVLDRIGHCLQHAGGTVDACELCKGTQHCQWRG